MTLVQKKSLGFKPPQYWTKTKGSLRFNQTLNQAAKDEQQFKEKPKESEDASENRWNFNSANRQDHSSAAGRPATLGKKRSKDQRQVTLSN